MYVILKEVFMLFKKKIMISNNVPLLKNFKNSKKVCVFEKCYFFPKKCVCFTKIHNLKKIPFSKYVHKFIILH